MLPKKFFDSSPQLVEALKSNNETLQNINRLFNEHIKRFHIYFFHESKPMDMKGTRQFIVDEDSAAPDIPGVERMGIESDHSHMCKFEDENAPGYDVVAEAVKRYGLLHFGSMLQLIIQICSKCPGHYQNKMGCRGT